MKHDLPDVFTNALGSHLPPLPVAEETEKKKKKKKNMFNRNQQMRAQLAKDVVDARQRVAQGFDSFGFRPKKKK